MDADDLRRSRTAFGIAVVCGLFLAETVVAHASRPHPASPYLWAALGTAGAAALGYGWRCRRRHLRGQRDAGAAGEDAR